jgi:uncharacterized damage-inducible protein DinB
MIDILRKQYNLVQGSRAELLKFVETQVGANLNTPVAAFEERTIRYILIHIAGCYFHWLERFAVKRDIEKLDNEDFATANQIRALFAKVDEVMMVFLKNFDGKMELPINRMLSPDNRQVSATPLEIFIHVTTHEFHHKGQIVTMCRLLGHPPPDTDVIRF